MPKTRAAFFGLVVLMLVLAACAPAATTTPTETAAAPAAVTEATQPPAEPTAAAVAQVVESGCTTCHPDLAATLPEGHPAVPSADVAGCVTCHKEGGAAASLNAVIHYAHYSSDGFPGDCSGCHALDDAGSFSFKGVEGGMAITTTQEVLDQMGTYYKSWSTSEFLDHVHAQQKVSCETCHGGPLPTNRPEASACEQCHGTYAEVAELTAEVEPNPHDSHMLEIRCTLCHKFHEESELYCNQCHKFELEMP